MNAPMGISASFWQIWKAAVLGAALWTAAGSGSAQSGLQWYALDTLPPGTPPTIALEPSSNLHQTDLDITIHGFYFEDIEEMGQTFRRLTLDKKPDGTLYRIVGRPELPALHHTMGDLVDASMDTLVVQVIDEITLLNMVIYPAQPEHIINDPPPNFQWDQTFYQQTTQPYPPTQGAAVGSLGRFGGLALLGAETYPFRVIPANQTLLIARHFRVSIPHPGTGTPVSLEVTRRQNRQYELLLDNALIVAPYRPPLLSAYAGEYLIITTPGYILDVEPLAEQKRRRGYAVTVASTVDTGPNCDDIKDYITNWWTVTGPERSHYVLLVGRVESIPTCTDENGRVSDRVYACIDGLGGDGLADPYPEIRLGRLPCRYLNECIDMVTKTLNYEDGYPGWFVGHVLLTAHLQEHPAYFEETQENIRTETYAVPPVFTTLYGGEGATNDEVRAEINAGKGIVCYNGHGTKDTWAGWNGWDFDRGDVALLENGEKTPVVISLSCLNNGVPLAPHLGIGETWMMTTERAVAHYSPAEEVSIGVMSALGPELFKMIYDEHQVILGEALTTAENEILRRFEEVGMVEYDIWTHVLFGDPDLKIWREPPEIPAISGYPSSVPPEPGAIEVQVEGSLALGTSAEPVEFAIVSLYKPGEFQENRYTNSQGIATVPINPTSPGWIYLTVYTEFDSRAVAHDSILVTNSTGAPGENTGERALRLHPPYPNPFTRETVFSYTLPQAGPVRLSIVDAEGRLVTTILDSVQGSGPHVLLWNGLSRRGEAVASGIYFARLQVGGDVCTQKIVVVR